jgi:hypothetical protein
MERGTQNGVTADGSLKRPLQRREVERPFELEHELVDVLSRSLRLETVKQQPLLEGGQDICSFDTFHGGHEYPLAFATPDERL